MCKDLSWNEWQTITPNKDSKYMCVHRFASGLYDMQSMLIDKASRKSITDEVKIRKLLKNIPDIIEKTITPHLTDDMT